MAESPESVFNNVQYFVGHVMKEASSNNRWTREELKKAFKWAQYCNAYSLDLKDINQLDRFIQSVSDSMAQQETKQISTTLRNPILAFNMAILQNANMDNRIFRELLDLNLEARSDDFLNDLVKLVAERNVAAQLLSLGTDKNSVFHIKFQIDFRIAYLKEAFESKRSEEAIKDFVEASFECEYTLVMMINVAIELGKLNDCKSCFECLIGKVLDKCSANPLSRMSLMNAENAKLADLCVQSSTFYKYYVDFLTGECEWLFISEENGMSWDQSPDHLPFESLLKHWSQLVERKDVVGKTTANLLRDFASNARHSIWLEIYSATCSSNSLENE